jgi:hypothetical protein
VHLCIALKQRFGAAMRIAAQISVPFLYLALALLFVIACPVLGAEKSNSYLVWR